MRVRLPIACATAAVALLATASPSLGAGRRWSKITADTNSNIQQVGLARTDDRGDWVPVAKKSAEKSSVGGRKSVRREYTARGVATAEVIGELRKVAKGGRHAPPRNR